MNYEIRNGDCTKLLPQSPWHIKADVIITDPPYDIEYPQGLGEYTSTGTHIVFCKPENQPNISPTDYAFWIKTPSTKNFSKSCGRFVEMILICRTPDSAFNPLHWSQMTGVYDDRLIYPPVHPFEKPLSLIERLIRIYTNEGDVVLDPYMGSGTTGVACMNLNRSFIGIEKDKEYFEIAKQRIEDAEKKTS